jgi:molybdate transport system substrate-binding protein
MRTRRAVLSGLMLIVPLLTAAAPTSGEELRVMSAGGTAATHLALVPQFERATGHKVLTTAVSAGVGREAILTRVRGGEPVDVLLLADFAMDEMIAEGRVVAATRVDFARSSIGMAVRKGAPKPDITTVEGFRRALLQATSIAISPQVSGIYLTTELFPRLGIAAQMRGKVRTIDRGRVGTVVGRGEAELGFQQISEILEVPEVELVGPLPAELQRITVFSAGVTTGAKNPAAARALIDLLVSPAGQDAMKKMGIEPIPRR